MNITPINYHTNFAFKADTKSVDETTGKYSDPLMHWPLRAASYTNEVGEILRPLIGGYATLGWAPVLMYIGADVYDKYKNNQDEYSPSSERFLKQALYQGVSTLTLPVLASRLGQDIFSQLGRLSSNKLTLTQQAQISKIAETYIMNGKLNDKTYDNCKKEFLDVVHNTIDFKKQEKAIKNPIKKILYKLEEQLKISDKINIEKYANDTIDDLLSLAKRLEDSSDNTINDKWYKLYLDNLKSGQTKSIASRSVLKQFQEAKMIKGKILKTLGGFIAVILTIKPIDNFVDNIVFGKVVNPGFKKLENFEISDLNKKISDNISDKYHYLKNFSYLLKEQEESQIESEILPVDIN